MKLASLVASLFIATYVAGSSVPDPRKAPTAFEAEWLEQATKVEKTASQQHLTIYVLTQSGEGVAGSPANTSFYKRKDGSKLCAITIIAADNPMADIMFDHVPWYMRKTAIKTILLHELGHCAQYFHDTTRVLDEAEMKKEAYADVYALAVLARGSSSEYNSAVAFATMLRTKTSPPPDDPVQRNSYERYDTMRYIEMHREIKSLGKKYEPHDVAAHIVYGEPLSEQK